MNRMTIGAAARAAGVGVETIRFYERRALIERPPKPAGGGYRRYPEATVHRIRFIREAQRNGFSLAETSELLALRMDSDADCASVRAQARTTLDALDRRLEGLLRMRASLVELITACPGRGPLAECSIVGAFEGRATRRRPRTGRAARS